jgi:hypothetical protein
VLSSSSLETLIGLIATSLLTKYLEMSQFILVAAITEAAMPETPQTQTQRRLAKVPKMLLRMPHFARVFTR